MSSKRWIIWTGTGIFACVAIIAVVYLDVKGFSGLDSTSIPSSTAVSQQKESNQEFSSEKKIGEERKLRSWERGGTTVTLYHQDIQATYEGVAEMNFEHILKVRRGKESERAFASYYLKDVEDVFISPLGTYVTADVLGYESRFADTYEVGSGEVVISGYRKIPYWTSDEKKVALIQSDSGIDGTPAAFYYSDIGNPRNAVLLRKFEAVDFTLRSSVQTGNLLTMTMTDWTLGDGVERKYLLDLQTGIVTSK